MSNSEFVEKQAEKEDEQNKLALDSEDSENDENVPNEYDKNDGFLVDDEEEEEPSSDPLATTTNTTTKVKPSKKRPREEDDNGDEDSKKPKRKRLRRLDEGKKGEKELAAEVADLMQDQTPALTYDKEEDRVKQRKRKNEERANRDENDMSDFIVGAKHRGGNEVDADMEDIFGDDDDLAEARGDYAMYADTEAIYDDDEDEEENKAAKMKKLYGEEALAEKYLTDEDLKIRKRDAPERMQLLHVLRNVSDDDLKKEAEWIYTNAFERRVKDITDGHDEEWKGKYVERISTVLSLYLKELLDIPFISMYRKEYFSPELRNDLDLWIIADYDEKYYTMVKKQKQVLEMLKKSDDMYKSLAQVVNTMDDLNDLVLHFQLMQNQSTSSHSHASSMQSNTKRPVKRDLYTIAKKSKLAEFAKQFGLTPMQFADNVTLGYSSHSIDVTPSQAPEELATAFVDKDFRSEEAVLKGVRHMIAQEISAEPGIRKKLRFLYETYAQVSAKLTPKGESSNVEGIRHLKNFVKVPVTELRLAYARDDHIVDLIMMVRAVKEGLATVSISLEDDSFEQVMDYKKFYLLSDDSDPLVVLWNKQREFIMQEVKLIVHPMMQTHVQTMLHREAEEYVSNLCQRELEKMLMKGPLGHVKRRAEGEQAEPETYFNSGKIKPLENRVLAVCGTEGEPTVFTILDKSGEYIDSLQWKFTNYESILQQRKDKEPMRNESMDRQLDQLRNMLNQHRPDIIALAASGFFCRATEAYIREVLSKVTYSNNVPIVFVPDDVAKIYENSRRAQQEYPNLFHVVRRTISIGRRLIDPLFEFSGLFNQNNDICFLKMHPLQDILPPETLKTAIERVFVRVVNRVGVDINLIMKHKHLQHTLQFVSGLGPRKALDILENFESTGRTQLYTRKELKESVLDTFIFINAAGFVRIQPHHYIAIQKKKKKKSKNDDDDDAENGNERYDILDNTRVHPENYDLAVKVCMDALEEEAEQDEVENVVEQILKAPIKLQELDLDGYADELEKRNMGKKHYILKDIRTELEAPFADPRESFRILSTMDLFYLLIGETVESFRPKKVVHAQVLRVFNSFALCRLENGLPGRIPENFLPADNLMADSVIEAMVDEIDHEKFEVILDARPASVEQNKEPEPMRPIPKKKHRSRAARSINHPNFKNFNFQQAMDYLKDKQIGEVVIRPSSKGENHLTVTFKFFGNTYINIDVKEGKKMPGSTISNELFINDKKYEDLDEICHRYVNQMIDHAKALMKLPKFKKSSTEEIDATLKKEKEANPATIPYYFSLNNDHPGRFYIHYMPNKRVKRDNVSVTPDGFSYVKRHFSNPTKLINAFKRSHQDGGGATSSQQQQQQSTTSSRHRPMQPNSPGEWDE